MLLSWNINATSPSPKTKQVLIKKMLSSKKKKEKKVLKILKNIFFCYFYLNKKLYPCNNNTKN